MQCGWLKRKSRRSFIFFISIIAIAMILLPEANALDADNRQQMGTLEANPVMNVTNASLANHTLPSQYQITPALIKFQVEITKTALPGPKGEMASGPRVIGFSTTPETLAIVIIAIMAIATGAWYLIARKRNDKKKN